MCFGTIYGEVGTGYFNFMPGTTTGTSIFSLETYTTDDGLASNYVNEIAIDEEYNKWFATDNGVSLLMTEDTNMNISSLNKSSYLQNAPNPFNSETVIAYRLKNFSHVTLKIYNIIG